MSTKLKTGIAFLSVGCAAFTWILMFMQNKYPMAIFGMFSRDVKFSFAYAPVWTWSLLALSLLSVVKGARNIGKGVKGDPD